MSETRPPPPTITSPPNPTESDLGGFVAALKAHGWDTAVCILDELAVWPDMAVICRNEDDPLKALAGWCTLLLAWNGQVLYIGTRDPAGFSERARCLHSTDNIVKGPNSAFCSECVGAELLDLEQE